MPDGRGTLQGRVWGRRSEGDPASEGRTVRQTGDHAKPSVRPGGTSTQEASLSRWGLCPSPKANSARVLPPCRGPPCMGRARVTPQASSPPPRSSLQPSLTACRSANTSGTLAPQGLCTCCPVPRKTLLPALFMFCSNVAIPGRLPWSAPLSLPLASFSFTPRQRRRVTVAFDVCPQLALFLSRRAGALPTGPSLYPSVCT